MSEFPRTGRPSSQQWLLRAAADPQIALEEWRRGPAVLVAGRLWDAVRVPYGVLDADFNGWTKPAALRACIERLRLAGPVFCDPYRPHAYFLVPAGTDRTWPHDEFTRTHIVCLGGTTPYRHYVAVPRADRTEQPGQFWLVPPDSVVFRLVDAALLLGVLRERLGQAEPAPAQGVIR